MIARRLGVACVVSVGVLALAWPAGAAITPCGPAAARTLASSSGARVYSQGGVVYGCAAGSSHVYRLGSATLCVGTARAGPAAAAGALAAYGVERCGVDTGSSVVVVRRFSDGKQLSDHAAWSGSLGAESYVMVGSIAVNASATVAWISVGNSIVGHRHQVEVLESTGASVRVLQSGPSINAASLRARGSALTWKRGSQLCSARLGPGVVHCQTA